MKMTILTPLFLAATLGLSSAAALAADTGAQSNNGQANASADAGQVDKMLNSDGSTMNHDGMTSDEAHKNAMCKDGRCPESTPSDNGSKTDGTTQ